MSYQSAGAGGTFFKSIQNQNRLQQIMSRGGISSKNETPFSLQQIIQRDDDGLFSHDHGFLTEANRQHFPNAANSSNSRDHALQETFSHILTQYQTMMKKRNDYNNSPVLNLPSKTISSDPLAKKAMFSSRALPNTQLSPGQRYQSNFRRKHH
jgi:hypothetical protein